MGPYTVSTVSTVTPVMNIVISVAQHTAAQYTVEVEREYCVHIYVCMRVSYVVWCWVAKMLPSVVS